MKALTVLLSVVPGIGCYLGLIDGGYGVIEKIKSPAHWRGVIGVRLICREIDSDYSTPPAFPFRVLYSSQPRFDGFRLPDKGIC